MLLKVSIITATYNSAATVAETMRSVEEQDYPHDRAYHGGWSFAG